MVELDGSTFLTLGIIVSLIFMIYTGIKKQKLSDTLEEIKEMFGGKE